MEFLANARYVGPNNNQRLAPFTLVNLGLSHALGMGRLTVFASNLFNTESGNFSTLQYAQPIPLSGGGQLLQAANPNAPRQYTVSYSFNTGARPGAGLSRGAAGGTRGAQTAGAAGTQNQQRGNLGFGRIQFIAPPPGVDPLTLAASRTECTADLKPEAQKVLAQLGVAATAYAAGQPLPAVEGMTVTPHGDPKGTWYLGLNPNIPQSVLDKLRAARPPAAAGAGGQRRPPGGEPGGPGGPPGGFQDRVTASSPDSTDQRQQFTPPPELIAALLPLRAVSACAYGTVLTTTEAKAKGYEVEAGVQAAPSPGPSASPAAAPASPAAVAANPAPGASPRPGESPRPNRGANRGNALYYAPNLGLFVVRPPDLGTGGGSVKK